MYKKILVPIDGSGSAKRGLGEAIKLARHLGAQLRLIHVVDAFVVTPTLEGGPYVDEIRASLRAHGAKLLKRAEALANKQGITSDSVLLEIVGGSAAADVIVAQARKWHADLIVIGTHGRRGIRRLIMGSDAELIVRTSPVPVLIIRSRASAR